MKDLSVYYGEVAFVTSSGEVDKGDMATEEEKEQMKLIRHGYGVQLFGTNSQDVLCKYQGDWKYDKRHGTGKCIYPNGDVYEGSLEKNQREGKGKYVWQDGKTYEGNWHNNMMDGEGTFTHPSGHSFSGTFRANYFIHRGLAVNPLLDKEEFEEDLLLQDEHKKKAAKLEEARQKQVKLYKVEDLRELPETLEKVKENGRIAVVLCTQECLLEKSEIVEAMKSSKEVLEIDLRGLSNIRKEQGKEAVKQNLRETISKGVSQGNYILLNLDDSEVKYEALHYPDVQYYFNPTSFPPLLFKPALLAQKPQVWDLFKAGEDIPFDQSYHFLMWSKSKLPLADDQDLLDKFEKKFKNILPLESVDLVLCHQEETPESP